MLVNWESMILVNSWGVGAVNKLTGFTVLEFQNATVKGIRTTNLWSLPVGGCIPGKHGRMMREKYYRMVLSQGCVVTLLHGCN